MRAARHLLCQGRGAGEAPAEDAHDDEGVGDVGVAREEALLGQQLAPPPVVGVGVTGLGLGLGLGAGVGVGSGVGLGLG